jgi:hypothetical protein
MVTDISGVPRDRFIEAGNDIVSHLSDKIMALTRTPLFKERLQTILDPLINHVINRVFPYILFSSILFLVILLVTIGTFIIVVRGSASAIKEVNEMVMQTGVPDEW